METISERVVFRSLFLKSKFPMKSFLLALFLLAPLCLSAQAQQRDEKLDYAQKVLEQALQRNDSAQIAEGYYLLGKYEEKKYNFSEAYRIYNLALAINSSIQDHDKKGRIFVRLSGLELKQQHLEKAKHYAQEAIRIFS